MNETVYDKPYRPSVRLVVMDMSGACSEDFLARCGGGYYDVYFFDEHRAVYLCEMTASAELHFIGGVPAVTPDDEEASEALANEIMDINADTEEVTYMWHHEAMRASFPVSDLQYVHTESEEVSTEKEYRDEMDSWREFFLGNAGAENATDHWLKKQKEQKK